MKGNDFDWDTPIDKKTMLEKTISELESEYNKIRTDLAEDTISPQKEST